MDATFLLEFLLFFFFSFFLFFSLALLSSTKINLATKRGTHFFFFSGSANVFSKRFAKKAKHVVR